MTDDRVADGVEHLQAAALELIAAARAFLDVAEDVVGDPDRVSGALTACLSLFDTAARMARSPAAESGDPAGPGDELSQARIRRIDVS